MDEASPNRNVRQIGMISVQRVMTEGSILMAGPGEPRSIGQIIDELLEDSLARGHQVRQVSLDLSEEGWEEFSRNRREEVA